ncbi:probable methyltransferase-like protein 24, partial [Symsagittifera roscoffensis]|uniref:probable methyltransferase-like protein 24 n=1 Tax=Symsagittifera roscoffensis TaxID=84072 RepID=UPI00307BF1BC
MKLSRVIARRKLTFLIIVTLSLNVFAWYHLFLRKDSAKESNQEPEPRNYITKCANRSKPLEKETPFHSFICKEDLDHVAKIPRLNSAGSRDDKTLATEFWRLITKPVQSACKKLVRVGTGNFPLIKAAGWRSWDGHKYVCADDFHPKSTTNEQDCLVYSFGISDDLSFEDAVAAQGCEVFAFDHTIKRLPSTKNSRKIHWKPIGLGVENSETLKTLGTLIAENDHTNRIIQYLKVDVEGAEREAMIEWMTS